MASWQITLANNLAALRQRRARILAYHSISDTGFGRWSVTPRQFEQHMKLLRDYDLNVVSLAELTRQIRVYNVKPKTVAVTFDDGYLDFIDNAFPILSKYNIPTTVFVVPGKVGTTSTWSSYAPDAPLMTYEQIECIHRGGIAVGSHGMAHVRLAKLTFSELDKDMRDSHHRLCERLGTDELDFAFPFGDFGRRESILAQALGYRCAVGFGGIGGNGPESDLFALKRDPIGAGFGDRAFLTLLSGWQDWLVTARILVEQGAHFSIRSKT